MTRPSVVRLRHIAALNPDVPEFDRLPADAEVTFLPLEAVWPGDHLDTNRSRPKHEVINGYTRFREGDILIPKITPTFQANRSVIAHSLRGHVGCGSTELHVLRARPDLDARFASYVVSSRPFLQYGEAAMIGVAGQQRVPEQFILDYPVELPDLVQQRAIADFLDRETTTTDTLIARKQRMMELLHEMMAAIRYSGVSGKLTSPDDAAPSSLTWLERHPKRWPTPKLTHVSRLGSGHTPSRDHPEWWVDCSIPWITTGEVAQMRSDRIEYIHETREQISQIGVENSAAVVHPAGTVVLCRTASAGYSAIMATAMATSQDFATWTCGPLLRPRFLLLCLRVMRPDLLRRLAMGSTHKTIYMPDIESIRIPLPSLEEQDQIVEAVIGRLQRLFRASDSLNRQIQLLREHHEALVTAAVAGQIHVATATA